MHPNSRNCKNGTYVVESVHNQKSQLNELILRFQNVTTHIKELSDQLELALVKNRNCSTTPWHINLVEQYFYKIDDSIALLQHQVNKIHEIITSFKIEVISRHILDSDKMATFFQ